MKKITFILAFLVAGFAYSQDRTCGMTAYMEKKMQDPEFAKEYLRTQELFKEEFRKSLEDENYSQRGGTVQIPVAVHFPEANEADRACLEALAQNQVDILNADYSGTNADISDWGAASGNFPGVNTGAADIEFCIATSNHPGGTDPDLVEGGPAVTIGYNFGGGGDVDANWSGYMNFLVKNIGPLGYSPLGGSAAAGQSVVLDNNAFASGAGCPGSGIVPGFPYNLGRTTTHELGHFYNLFHTFTGSCGTDDGIADTPNIANQNFGCPGNIPACSPGEFALTMSYMDYTDDRCMYMFSAGQTASIDTYMNILAPQFHTDRCEPAVIYDLDGRLGIENLNVVDCGTSTMTPDVRLTNAGNNTLTSATISYYIDGDAPVDYPWTGSLAIDEFEIISLPEIITTAGAHTFYAELSDPNGSTDMNTANDNASASHTYTGALCASVGNMVYATSTEGVVINDGSTDILSNLNTGKPAGYSDYTGMVTDLARAESYDLTVNINTDGNFPCETRVWIDWNQNCSFDPSEEYDLGGGQNIINGPTSNSPLSFDVPSDAVLGNTTMRVTTQYDSAAGPCDVTDGGGASVDAEVEDYTINVMPSLSIAEFGLNSISIYPNPASDVLNISLSNNDLPNGYRIYNMLGQTLSQKVISTVSDLSVNTANLSDGMYFIKITRGGNSVSLPFIKK